MVQSGTEALLFQPTLNTTDNYNFGVSLRFIPRTNLNYDQFYTYYKGDTTANLATTAQNNLFGVPGFFLPGGIPVNPGIVYNSAANQPCGPLLVGGFVNTARSSVTTVLATREIHSPRSSSVSRATISGAWICPAASITLTPKRATLPLRNCLTA
jgi:hypothetical protein